MAIGTKYNLLDVAKRVDPSGKLLPIAEMMSSVNEILEDIPFIECNDGSGHIGSIRTGLPTVTWTELNYGVQPSKSTSKQIKDTCGMLEAYSQIDKRVLQRAGKNVNEVRADEDVTFLEAMNQEMASALFYGNVATDPKKFTGLAPRYNSSTAASYANVLTSGANSGAMTSIWLVGWGPLGMHAIYPQNSAAGFTHEDLGEVTLTDAAGGLYQGVRSHYKWDIGFHQKDWRYAVRIQVDSAILTKDATAGADLVDLMVQAVELLPNTNLVKPVFYCNQKIKSFLRRQVANKENVSLSLDEVAGKKILSLDGFPIRKCDKILNTEATIA